MSKSNILFFKEIYMRDDGNGVETDVFKKRKIKMNCIFLVSEIANIVVHHNKEFYKGYWTRVHVNA